MALPAIVTPTKTPPGVEQVYASRVNPFGEHVTPTKTPPGIEQTSDPGGSSTTGA